MLEMGYVVVCLISFISISGSESNYVSDNGSIIKRISILGEPRKNLESSFIPAASGVLNYVSVNDSCVAPFCQLSYMTLLRIKLETYLLIRPTTLHPLKQKDSNSMWEIS